MIPSFLITFRETLEASLVIGIVLSYLRRTNQTRYFKLIYTAIFSALVTSIIAAFLFTTLAGGFKGRAEEIFEGVTMLLGALLLTTMILWMMNQKHIARELEEKVALEISEAHKVGLFFLVFTAVLREGIETVIFLGAASFVSANNNLIGALAGILSAILLGFGIFLGSMKINLKRFFSFTSILLILFAAGLIAQGIHELEEAKLIPTFVKHLWDVNPPLNSNGSYPLLHEKGYLGSILKELFGYDGNPSLIQVVSYFLYLIFAFSFWRYIDFKKLKERKD